VACTGFNALAFPAWIEELSPTWYTAGPALHRAILEIAKQDPVPFRRSPLRFVRCGSGAGSPALLNELERVLQVDVINGYGLTEIGSASNTPPGLPKKTGSVGRSIGPEIAIVDSGGTFLSPGSEGEVVLRGDGVMEGYLGADEANRNVFLSGWFRTGDLGRMDTEGDLFITGRVKEVINRGGETISPLEIDHAMEEHPSILRAASFAVAHPTLGEDIVAALVLRPGARAVASDIRNFLAERLSRSKVPGRIWFVESLPLSASGKPIRDALRTQFQASAQAQESSQPRVPEDEGSALQRDRIGALWMRVLNSDRPEPEDNFFAMGGDSLSAARMFALLGSELQIDEASTDLAAFLDSPTFFQLIQVVAKRAHRAEIWFENVSAVCLQPAGGGSPVFFVPAEAMKTWYLRHLVQAMGDQQPFFALRHELSDSANFTGVASRLASLISRIHPTGPIVLAGHCYGGILAYEVARMLAMSRTEVAVVLINVNAPGYPKPRAGRYWRYFPTAFRAVLRGEGGKLAAEVAGHFRFLAALRERKRSYREPLRAGDSNPGGPVVSLTPGGIVLRTYVPRPFPGRMANALAADQPEGSERVLHDPRKGWRELARGSFQESTLPGSHFSMFDSENAPALAKFIRSAFQPSRTAVP
jgi:thioesterase domain-containing protein